MSLYGQGKSISVYIFCHCLCMGVESKTVSHLSPCLCMIESEMPRAIVAMSLYDESEVMSVCMVCLLSLHGVTFLLSLHDAPKCFGLVT